MLHKNHSAELLMMIKRRTGKIWLYGCLTLTKRSWLVCWNQILKLFVCSISQNHRMF